MLILLKMIAVLALMIILLKRKTSFGNAMLAASLLLFAITTPEISRLSAVLHKTVIDSGTWSMLLTLYFVMCLEHVLRTSGILKDFTASARKLFGSDRTLLGFMPAFLGFLPSLGGAIFSAPLVRESGQRYQLSPEKLTAINYWFRHVWEYSNPIVPAILLASQLTQVPVGALIANQFIFTIAAIFIGWAVLLTGKSYRNPHPIDIETDTDTSTETYTDTDTEIQPKETTAGKYTAIFSILLAAGPILVNLLLVIIFHLNTALSLGLVLSAMVLILKLDSVKIKTMFFSSFQPSIFWGIMNILFFQHMLSTTGAIDEIVSIFQISGIPSVALISLTAYSIGLLIGSPQGFVAVAFPLIIPLTQGSMDVIAMSYLAGIFGTMTSPAHLCLIITLQYFKADFIKSLLPIILMEILLVTFGFVYLYVF